MRFRMDESARVVSPGKEDTTAEQLAVGCWDLLLASNVQIANRLARTSIASKRFPISSCGWKQVYLLIRLFSNH
jgi:hypothetical protein